jgi:hypothetical protein
MKGRFFYLFVLVFISGCAGYHFNTNNNPLIGYNIRSISVPMFINRSVVPNLSGPMTREIVMALKDFSGLKVTNGITGESDAVLIGIVDSAQHLEEVVQNSSTAITEGNILNSIGNRQKFYYPSASSYQLRLRIILIKRPSAEEIEFLSKNTLGLTKLHPKVVLEDEIPLSGSFTRVVADNLTPNSGGEVNFVKNKGLFEKSLQDACVQTAKNFKQVVLNAF